MSVSTHSLQIALLSTLLHVAFAENYGVINVLSVPGATSDYQIDLIDAVKSYPAHKSISVIPISLLDDRNGQLLNDEDGSNARQLYLQNNTVDVYRDDLESFRSLYVTSLPLEPGCIPWYIQGSSVRGNGIFFVQYQNGCGYTQFYYDFEAGKFDEPWYIDEADIVVTTLDDYDIIVSVSYDKRSLSLDTTSFDYPSIIPADRVSADCVEFRKVFPLDPINERKVYFSVACSTSEAKLKYYSVEYWYRLSGLNMTVTPLDSGLPVGDIRYIAVRSTDAITLYDRTDLSNGVPGRHPFGARIRNIVFNEILNQTWLTVQLDSSNVFVINVSLFVASRGDHGVYELPDTNVDCIPQCLPMVATETELILVTLETDLAYSCVVFGFSTGKPEEIRRITKLPERPFAITFVPDPSFQPPTPIPKPSVIAPKLEIGVIVGPTVAVVVVLVLTGILVAGLLIKHGRKFSRSGYQTAERGSSTDIRDSFELQETHQPNPDSAVTVEAAAPNPSTAPIPAPPNPSIISNPANPASTPGTPTIVTIVIPKAPSRPKNLKLQETSENKEPNDVKPDEDDPKTPLIPQQPEERPIQEDGVPVPETTAGIF